MMVGLTGWVGMACASREGCLGGLLEFPGCVLVWIFRCELRLRFDVWCSLLIMLPVGWYNIVLLYLGRFW